MKILITIALTALALGLSVLSFKFYFRFWPKRLSSPRQVPLAFVGCLVCIVFAIVIPGAIIVMLRENLRYPPEYEAMAVIIWAFGLISCVMYRAL